MEKKNNVFAKKVIAFITSFAFVASAAGVSVVFAAITFSGTSITGDSSFTNVTGVVSSTWDFGAGTLSLQTASNSPITAGNGLFTIGGALTVNGAFTAGGPKVALSNLATSTAGNVIVANASNVPTYVALAGDISTVSATGSVALAASNGNLTTLSAISSIDRSGTITIGNTNGTGITIGRSGQTVSFPGSVSSTALLVTGNATTTNLSITALGGASGCLSVSASGAVTTSTCSGGGSGTVTTSTAISTNNFPFWGTAAGALTGTSTLSISGTTLTQAGNLLFSAGSAIDSSAAGTLLIGNTTTTGITIGRSGQTVTLPGNQLVTGPLLFSATGAIIDSNVAGTLLIGNTTSTGITIGRSGQTVSFPGNASTTGTATFLGALTQSGGTASLATTTVGGSLTINSGAPILKHLSATSSITFGVIASSSCATATMTVTGANAGDNVYVAPTPVASGIETVSASWSAYASSTGLIAIKACNPTITNTASVAAEVWRADVWQH